MDATVCGWDAGVGDYLDPEFAGDLPHLLGTYRIGLDALEVEARATVGVRFSELAPDAQDELLRRVEGGARKAPIDWVLRVGWRRVRSRHSGEFVTSAGCVGRKREVPASLGAGR